VAAKVVPYAPCHVLVIRSESPETPRKFLIAVDGGEQSAEVMAFGLDHALRAGATDVLFLNVIEEVTEVSHYYWGAFTVSPDFYEKATQSAREALEGMLDELKATRNTAGCALRTEVELGRSHATIIERAESEGSDLIVVGDRGQSGIEGFLLGSVSAKIVRYAPCGVLVCRTGRKGR
jgi:nucleotide-binding universal stress UspA family protein